ncbi:MAG: hypothetical protein Q4A68_09985, partial [Anaerobiospirillum succiniciproducens]|uniref:hypothetical protein n=1 Tax=Anaerobiospirillum succiniciproducens TaxID=13335 RepID=UPI0026DBA3A6
LTQSLIGFFSKLFVDYVKAGRVSSIAGEDLSAYALKRCSVLHGALSKGRFIVLAIATFEVALEEQFGLFAPGVRSWHLVMGSGAKLCCK